MQRSVTICPRAGRFDAAGVSAGGFSPTRFLSSRPAGRVKMRRRSAREVGWSAPLLWVLEGWSHGYRNADCGHTLTNPGGYKGGLCLPFGTRPCLQGVLCHTCWCGCRGKRRRCGLLTAFLGRKTLGGL